VVVLTVVEGIEGVGAGDGAGAVVTGVSVAGFDVGFSMVVVAPVLPAAILTAGFRGVGWVAAECRMAVGCRVAVDC